MPAVSAQSSSAVAPGSGSTPDVVESAIGSDPLPNAAFMLCAARVIAPIPVTAKPERQGLSPKVCFQFPSKNLYRRANKRLETPSLMRTTIDQKPRWHGCFTYEQLVTNRAPGTDDKVSNILGRAIDEAYVIHFKADSDGDPPYEFENYEDGVGPNHPDSDPNGTGAYWFFSRDYDDPNDPRNDDELYNTPDNDETKCKTTKGGGILKAYERSRSTPLGMFSETQSNNRPSGYPSTSTVSKILANHTRPKTNNICVVVLSTYACS